jgi:hypothetical protein
LCHNCLIYFIFFLEKSNLVQAFFKILC